MNISIIVPDINWCYIYYSSLVQGFRKVYKDVNFNIYFHDNKYNFLYDKENDLKITNNIEDINNSRSDLVVNLSYSVIGIDYNFYSNKTIGFIGEGDKTCCTSRSCIDLFNHIYIRKKNEKNIYELLFDIVGIDWCGEKPFISYKSKSKTKHNTTGISVKNEDIRHYIKSNLKLDLTKRWHVPIRQNPQKFVDEISKCSMLITDDIFASFVGISERKYTYYLDYEKESLNMIFFGKGKRQYISKTYK